MNLGVVTWFKYENYGTKLQAFALQAYLHDLGHKVCLINLSVNDKNKGILKKIQEHSVLSLCDRLLFEIVKLVHRDAFALRSKKLGDFVSKNCCLTECVDTKSSFEKICNSFDAVICGSDQIWNPNFYNPLFFFGGVKISAKKIAYAPSFGVNTIPENLKNSIANDLKNIDEISVREHTGAQIVCSLIGFSPQVVVDPTLLLSASQWVSRLGLSKQVKEKSSSYILIYFLGDNLLHWKAARRYAKEKNLAIKVIPPINKGFAYFQQGEVMKDVGVEDFLNLIRNAEFVITDSFHGLIFSLIFRKQFVVFERHNPNMKSGQNSRILDMLELLSLTRMLLPYNSTIILEKCVTYDEIDLKIKDLVNHSKTFLHSALLKNEATE